MSDADVLADSVLKTTVADNLKRVREQIAAACEKAGRKQESVRLVAVSKRQPVEKIRAALAAGQRDFGENYAQELRDKAQVFAEAKNGQGDDVKVTAIWHFIGHIQSNKIRYIAPNAAWVHTLADVAKGQKIVQRAAQQDLKPQLLIEVNIGKETQKSGVMPDHLESLLADLAEQKIDAAGLMCMPPAGCSPAQSTAYFAELRKLAETMTKQSLLPEKPELSMGMSADFALAIAEGASIVRVGTAIFGFRPPVVKK